MGKLPRIGNLKIQISSLYEFGLVRMFSSSHGWPEINSALLIESWNFELKSVLDFCLMLDSIFWCCFECFEPLYKILLYMHSCKDDWTRLLRARMRFEVVLDHFELC